MHIQLILMLLAKDGFGVCIRFMWKLAVGEYPGNFLDIPLPNLNPLPKFPGYAPAFEAVCVGSPVTNML